MGDDAVMAKPYSVTRSISIDAPADRVHGLIDDFQQWPDWSPWEGLDPGMRRTYSGPATGPSARYQWEGNKKAGKGSMEITSSSPGSIGIDLHFEKPFPARNTITFTLTPTGDRTGVAWRMDGQMGLLLRLFSIVKPMDGLVGPDFEKGLRQLKATAESPAG